MSFLHLDPMFDWLKFWTEEKKDDNEDKIKICKFD
jgi:hypothetical protein